LLRPSVHALAGLYAIDALETPAEKRRFERHLDRCGGCTDEVRGLYETVSLMAIAAARQPPPTLRPRVMAAVATASQLPATAQSGPARPPAARSWHRVRRASPLPRLAVITAAASGVAAVVLAVALVVTQQRLDHVRGQNQAITAVLSAGDARILSHATTKGGSATVVVSAARRQMVVTAAALPPLPSGEVYQLWLIGPPKTRSAGLLPAPGTHAGPVLASGLAPGDSFGMTVEPAGGTAQPTTTPIVVITLPG
jgi:anti-sigma-K factor RskA